MSGICVNRTPLFRQLRNSRGISRLIAGLAGLATENFRQSFAILTWVGFSTSAFDNEDWGTNIPIRRQ